MGSLEILRTISLLRLTAQIYFAWDQLAEILWEFCIFVQRAHLNNYYKYWCVALFKCRVIFEEM